MKTYRATLVCLLVCAVAAFPAALAGDPEVRVYTNADLERFPVTPDSEVRAADPNIDEWRFVTEYLARQYSRLDADREYSMDRERAEAETELIRRRANRRGYALPFYWNPYARGGRFPGKGDGGAIKRATLPGGSIRPLHAGPTRAQVDHFKATRRSGASAFPSNSRGRSPGGDHKR